jgi:mRNA interferase RelE/StbE
LPLREQAAIIAALERLAATPRTGKPLVGELAGIWSLRRGDYRVLYRIDDNIQSVEVARIAHRRDMYRRRGRLR